MMVKRIVLTYFLSLLMYPAVNLFTQETLSYNATYFNKGINSPWCLGLDYDVGFSKVLSFNTQFLGGISSQVNRNSTFGEVFFGEFNFGPRLYMNKIDRWDGLFLSLVARIGYYNIPFRATTEMILSRSNMFQYGMGFYFGYRWKRDLVHNMKDFPFILVIEPYLGWSLDSFAYSGNQNSKNINRFTFGLTFKLGFYTHLKSKKTLEREKAEAQEAENQKTDKDAESQNDSALDSLNEKTINVINTEDDDSTNQKERPDGTEKL